MKKSRQKNEEKSEDIESNERVKKLKGYNSASIGNTRVLPQQNKRCDNIRQVGLDFNEATNGDDSNVQFLVDSDIFDMIIGTTAKCKCNKLDQSFGCFRNDEE